jgi:CDP-paratose synthetase
MKILITGATGSIGKGLTKALVKHGHSLASTVRSFEKVSSSFTKEETKNILFIDIQEPSWSDKVVDFNPEVVIHLAALLTSRDDLEIIPALVESNITFGAELLKVLSNTNFKLFINTGTFAEYFYGDGVLDASYLYSATKTAFHSIIKYYQQVKAFKVVNVIPYTVYGQVDSQPKIIDIIYNSFYKEVPATMSGGEQNLDFIHIGDVIDFYCLLVSQQRPLVNAWEDYHLGTGKGNTLRRIANIISNNLGLSENINWGSLPYRPRDTMHSVAPIAKIVKHFGWNPSIGIEEGIQKFIAEKKRNTF